MGSLVTQATEQLKAIIEALPKASGVRTDLQPAALEGKRLDTKTYAISELGLTPKQARDITSISHESYQKAIEVALEKNILSDGIRDPLVLWGDILVDGHNRYKIAQQYGLPYKTVQKEFSSENDVKKWIIENQLGRRNLPAYERARLALAYKPIIAEKAKENQGARTDLTSVRNLTNVDTKKELAKIAGYKTCSPNLTSTEIYAVRTEKMTVQQRPGLFQRKPLDFPVTVCDTIRVG